MKSRGFTLQSAERLFFIETKGAVSKAFVSDNNHPHPPILDVSMVWDTGSVMSMISKRIAKKLGLIPCGKNVSSNSHGTITVELYRVNIILPNHIEISNIMVQCDILPDVDMLLGMDVISMTDFSITNKGTTFSFQIPSTHQHDYQQECAE